MGNALFIAGVDEAGRGPLAGPVIAAAVILDPDNQIAGLTDSKLLSLKRREALYQLIIERAMAYAVGEASVAEIDRLNILQASLLAMRRAVETLTVQPHQALVDGNQLPRLSIPARAIIKGDQSEPAISAASIIAKVTRDRMMQAFDQQYSQYGFSQHKGYGTKQHILMLQQHGPCPIHRQSFAPVRECQLVE